MANNNRLLAPPIFIDTSQASSSSSTIEQDNISPDRPFSSNGSFLTAHSPISMDGETLRSRANSFNSNVDTLRSRSDSMAHKDLDNVHYDDVPVSEALNPDQRNENDFKVDNNPFAFTPGQLNKMLNPKSLAAFRALGGLRGLERGLRTDLAAGLSFDESQLEGTVTFEEATRPDLKKGIETRTPSGIAESHTGSPAEGQFTDRVRVFKQNRLPERKSDGFFVLLWRAYNDKIIILLTIAAVVSLSLGLYETFSGGSKVDWIEGVAICAAIIIVTVVTAANDWQKERQFVKLNRRKNDREVKAIRSGKSVMISVFDITVGDILHLEPGDAVPADGVFVSGHGVKCDESSATGESDQMKKTSGHEVWQRMEDGTATKKLDPFIISGSKVLEGVGTYLVTSVGPNSTYGKIMLSLQTSNDPTPLQVKLGKMADWIGGLGTAAALLLFFILLIRFLVHLPENTGTPAAKGKEFMEVMIVAITVIVVAIPAKPKWLCYKLVHNYLGLKLLEERANAEITQLVPFDSARKCMGVVVRQDDGSYRLHVKGAAEMMLAKATQVISDLSQDSYRIEPLQANSKDAVLDTINSYSQRSLRTIGMVYKDFECWPPRGAKTQEDDKSMADFDDIFHNMTWIGVVGIQDPLRPEVPNAIQKCNMAGVQVKMVTGDNMTTAVAIATECGIKTPEGTAMEGPKFRQLSDEEMDRILPNLQVLARSSPEDKRILVARLKHLGETVAVTGDGTNDGPALRTADVGFSMGIAGTEVAKEASSIILLDDNFKSIVTAICWGRAVNDAVARFLQFQITVNITAVALTFISAVSNDDNKSVLTAVQLLWVNLIMDTFAALALATDAPTEKILDRKPTPKSASLFTMTMWKMIIGQSIYQLVVTFTLYFAGAKILNYDVAANEELQKQLDTIVFNTFVWMQIFNEFNNRRLDNKFNIFEGMLKNYWFMGINCLMIGGQIMIIFIGGIAIGVVRLDGVQWAICILCAVFCLPWAIVLRCIPDKHFAVVFNGATGAVAFVWRPFAKAMSFVFSPVGRMFSAIWAPFRRFCSRIKSKFVKKDPSTDESEAETYDEEAPKFEKEEGEKTPQPAHANLPPITLTGPS
ncbi:Na/K-ATPase alpha 2 subunit [Uncinocarpus reesii 1704]|uniref:Calcium-transporting ATPase n=1 Tax=Uncinocarpus reesii (strain UAMH 1704) TaxID=336963 RepID=C4JZC8_UNCRE|nr:Na/K-ATPase alpha 2 subunit [Uncinocarpus reesii 1704]EEP82664.1 Na/K-ATPase alpha 2 subunit [Uncinocarpus reesii 1704]